MSFFGFSYLKRRQTPKKSLKVMISSRSPRLLRKFTRSPVVVYSSRGGASWSASSPSSSFDGSSSSNERGSDSPGSSLGRSTVSSTTSERSDFSSSDGPPTRRQQSHSPVQLKPTLFCSVARAKTDYIPSPYDTGALAFKKGDLIYITRKPSGGYWEGVCQNKSGKFKFTFVEELSREEMPGLEGAHTFPLGAHQSSASYVLHLQSVEELLRRIECEKYLSDFVAHDLASLEKFKNLREQDLDNLEITNLEHRVKLLTVAKLLLEPIKGLEEGETPTSTSGESPLPTPSPRVDESDLTTSIQKLRIAARDSGFYASTEAGLCGDNSQSPARKQAKNSISSLEMLRESGLGSLCAEEEESASTDVSGVLAPGSNCNNSNNISGILIPGVDGHYLRMCDQYSGLESWSSWGGEVPKDKPLKPVRTDVKAVDLLARHSQFNNGATPVTVAHTMPPQILENCYEFPWMEDRSLHMTRQHRCSPKHQIHKLTQRSSSPVLVNYAQRGDQNQLGTCPSTMESGVQWKRSASVDSSVTCSNGWSNTVNGVVPSPQLVRAVGQTDSCPGLLLNSRRRKSRSVSPHKRHNLRKDTVSRDPVHASPTLPLRKFQAALGMHSVSLEKLLEAKLVQDGIDIKEEPYSDKMGFCGIPAALIQRYADEVQMRIPDVAVCLEALRVKALITEGRCWFRSDTLAHQAQHVIYAGRGSTVREWLTFLGMPMYVDAFIGGGWDELDILMDMEEEDLRRCGVMDTKHSRRLRTALEHLKMSAKV
ncbi:SAM and SH3 domain-containing protein 1-like [Diadema antillarum]|uniref:SAM and SH3 domain-containing protein 1-like n=1 Tax=Diadema antillarum TaxID=105358 RepID=UPI003A87DBFD